MKVSSCLKALVVVSTMGVLFESVAGTYVVVGGANGTWDMSTNYTTWAALRSFKVGEILVFKYDLTHDVLLVKKASYDSCDTTNPIRRYTGGHTIVPLKLPGKKYFICGSPGHCSVGQKFEINVVYSKRS